MFVLHFLVELYAFQFKILLPVISKPYMVGITRLCHSVGYLENADTDTRIRARGHGHGHADTDMRTWKTRTWKTRTWKTRT